MTQNEGTPDDRFNLTEEQEAYFIELGWYSRALFAKALAAFTRNDEPEGRRIAEEDQRLKRAVDNDRGTSPGEE
jgi:hypothetical protein